MRAEIINIGDELLIGQVVNTNQSYIAEKLNAVGINVCKMTTVGDNECDIIQAFDLAYNTYDVVVVTGGLGPTHDDVTRSAVCRFFNSDLVLNEEALANIRNFFAQRKKEPRKINEDQALVPRDCVVFQNKIGIAPGYLFKRDNKFFIVLPGVPVEMKLMLEECVIPFFKKVETGLIIRHLTIKTTGIAESFLAEEIGSVEDILLNDENASLAFLPSTYGVWLRVTVKGKTAEEVEDKLNQIERRIRRKIEKYIYSTDEKELEEVVGELLKQENLTLSIAESCTGGLIADRITNVPGSSEYFKTGVVTYSNESKIYELGVPLELIKKHGAVSKEVAESMAFGIRTKANTDIGLSTTGIAGPSGGSPEKPVGLVWIGYSDRYCTMALQYNFGGLRRTIKERASQACLELLRRKLLKIEI